jgi:Ca2+-binding EF-hand superfamily protein
MGGSGMGMPQAAPGEPLVLRYFDAIDTDRNQQLSRAELEAWVSNARGQFAAQVQQRFVAADANGDGQLSLDEARLGMPMLHDHFQFVDADRNGFVTVAEMQQLGDRELMRQRVLDRVRAADTDKNGKLDLAEVQAAFPGLASRFTLMDRDGDGYLAPDDFAGMGGF